MQRADQRKYHYIYKITRDDGRYYIGMHSTDDLEDGYFGSGKRITRSIKKHGKERHKKEILEFLSDRISLKQREKQLLSEDIRADVACMNIAPGGGGGFNNEVHAKKFHRAGWEAMQSKVDKSARSKKAWLNSQNMKIPSSNQEGENNSMFGKRHSSITRLKMSQSGSGEKNSQFGTCWITKNSKSVKIKKEQLDEYLANGYSRGRKF